VLIGHGIITRWAANALTISAYFMLVQLVIGGGLVAASIHVGFYTCTIICTKLSNFYVLCILPIILH